MSDLEMIRVLLDEAPPSAEVFAEGRQRIATGSTRSRPPRAHAPRPPRRRSPWLAPVAAAAGVTLAVSLAVVLGSRVHPGEQAGDAAGGPRPVYVFNWDAGTLTPISPVTSTLGRPVKVGPGERRIKLDGQWAKMPSIQQNLILPGGKTDYVVYLTESGGEMLRAVSLATGAAGKAIPLGPGAGQMVMTPDGKTAYVLYQPPRRDGEASVRPVSLATGTVGNPIPLARSAAQIAITPDGQTVYAVLPGEVTPISTATDKPGRSIPVPAADGPIPGADSLVFTSGGRTAWVLGANPRSGETATPISTATNRSGTPIRVGAFYDPVVFTPDGRTAYDITLAHAVTPISTATGKAGKTIKLLGAINVAITPDSKVAYVVDPGKDTVIPISTATNTVGRPISVSRYRAYMGPGNIVISPDGRAAYTYTYNGGVDKQVVTPISIATNTPGRPITVTARSISIVVAGDQVALTGEGMVGEP